MKQPLKYWFILIFARPGNCKSLEQARLSEQVLLEYFKTERSYKDLPHRLLITNQRLNWGEITKKNKKITQEFISEHLQYWDEPEEFRYCTRKECWKGNTTHKAHDIDLFIDEGSTLFPADGWKDTPIWLRKMWAQHRHNGIRIVMLTQDFKAIDINARRMLWQSFYMHKIIGSRDISATLPKLHRWSFINPFGSVWGIYSKQRIDPMMMEDDKMFVLKLHLEKDKKKEFSQTEDLKKLNLIGGSEMHLITWHKISLYDTQQDVREYEVKREIEHIQVSCGHPGCNYVHKTHRLK